MSVTDRSRYALVSDGGLTVAGSPGTGTVSHARSISGRTSGKFVIEVTIIQNQSGGNGFWMGFCEPSFDITTQTDRAGSVGLGAGFNASGVRFGKVDGYDTDAAFKNGAVSAWGDPGYMGIGPWQAASEAPLPITYMLAIDLDRHRFAYRNAGGWVSDQDPANGVGYVTMIANAFFAMGGTDINTAAIVNFGQTPFVFPIPAGFAPWQPTVLNEPTATLSFVSARAIASNDYQFGDWNFTSEFPAGEALLVIFDGEGNRSSTDLFVNGVKAQQYSQIGKPFYVYRLPDQGAAGTRSVKYATNSYWNNLRFHCLKPTGVDLSAPTNVTPGVFQYDDGTRTDQSLTVPAGGVGLALGENSTTEVGNRNRFLGWTKPLGTVIFDNTQTGLESTTASLDASSILWLRSRPYGGTNVGGLSFAAAVTQTISTGTVTGTATVAGAGAGRAVSRGTATGTGAAVGEGRRRVTSRGTITALATVTGGGSARTRAGGTITGTAAAAGVGSSRATGQGAATAAAVAQGAGFAMIQSTGAALGGAVVAGEGAAAIQATGAVTTSAGVQGAGVALVTAAGDARASAVAAGDGGSIVTATGTVVVSAVVQGEGNGDSTIVARGVVATLATVAGAGFAVAIADGTASISSTVIAAGGSIVTANGECRVTSITAGEGRALATGAGSASTVAVAAADGLAVSTGIGSAVTTAAAAADGMVLVESTGATLASAVAVAAGNALASADGAASIVADAAGEGQSIALANGTVIVGALVQGDAPAPPLKPAPPERTARLTDHAPRRGRFADSAGRRGKLSDMGSRRAVLR